MRIAKYVLESLDGAGWGLGYLEVYWPAYIRKYRIASGCIKVLHCVGVC